MRLQDQRDALDCRGVRTLTAFDEALLEQFLRIRKLRDAQAGRTLATKIVPQAFAIGGLGKHARQRKFADSASASEKQRMRDAAGAESATECRDDAFVAKKIGKRHALPPLARGRGRKHSFDGGKDFDGYFFGLANSILRRVKTLDGRPGGDA